MVKEGQLSESKKRKIAQAEELSGRISAAKVVAIVDLTTTPGSHISSLRKKLGNDANILVRKKAVIERALAKAAETVPTLSGLAEFVARAQPALILSSIDAFKLQGRIAKAKVPARAKPGRIPTKDIIVPAGDTGLPPGPAIGDLQKINLPAKIQKGKIVVEKETIVTKAGEAVTKDVSDALLKLGLEPFETELNVLAAWQDGVVYRHEILAVDEVQVFENFMKAHSWAFNLAVEAAYPTLDTVEALVKKAALNAASVALETKTVPGENISAVLLGAAS
jgi:large subunit ribosomal protein L10